MDSAAENNRHLFIKVVRVKTCGKSARLCAAMYVEGKPYQEQDKVGVDGGFVPVFNTRVCRIDKWLSTLPW